MEVQILSSEIRSRKRSWPEVVLFGRSATGESVAIAVPYAKPYLLVKTDHSYENVVLLAQFLSRELNKKSKYWGTELLGFRNPDGSTKLDLWGVRQLVFVQQEPIFAREFYGYDPNPSRFFKLELPDPGLVFKARNLLLGCAGSRSGGEQWMPDDAIRRLFPGRAAELAACQLANRRRQYADAPFGVFSFRVAEANLELGMSVCDTLGITPGGWVTAPMKLIDSSYKRTIVKHEVEGRPERLDKDGNAPVRVLSWDIEVITKDLGGGATQFFDGDSPNAQLLCISAVWFDHGKQATTSMCFSLSPEEQKYTRMKAADDPKHIFVTYWFASELQLINAFCDYVNDIDPDVITGYNINGFDIPWLLKRLAALGVEKNKLPIGRLNNSSIVELKGDNQRIPFLCPGRVMMDLYGWVKKNRQLRQYNLDYVAEEYLGMKKLDVAYSEIGEMQSTPEGRHKLAQYCELDSRLVCSLFRCKKLDVLNRELAVSLVCKVMLQDLNQKGTQNLLRGKLIGAAHSKGFVLPFEPALGDEELEDAEYEGGKVLSPLSGYYSDPISCLDFASLYPSCMMQNNMCKSTQVTREQAVANGWDVFTPWAPDLGGTYDDGTVIVENDDGIKVGDEFFKYENDLNMAIVSKAGRRAELVDFGYGLQWEDGSVSTRVASDILCFVKPDLFPGIISQLEVDLKADRKAAKKKMFAAEIAGDKALHIFYDNLQASIKVVMNGLYGGLGSKRGGLFPAGFKLAAAITSEGRHLICTVKQTVERFCWIKDADTFGIGEERPDGAEAVRIVYGDTGTRSFSSCGFVLYADSSTDSVFMWLKGLSLKDASDFSENISKFFNGRLPPPHDLEFEKIYFPYLLYKKKMYSGLKYEPGAPPLNLPLYDPENKPKVHSRGLSVVRRDNALVIKTTMTNILKMTTTLGTTRESILDTAASAIVATKNAAQKVHQSGEYEQFICSAGISKALDSYDHPVAAVEIAKQMMAENDSVEVSSGTRVTFVVAAALKGAKRAEQAILLDTLKRQKMPLDWSFYCEALMKKLGPLLSVFFVKDELVKDAFGELVRAKPKTKAEASILPGQRAAEAALRARISELSTGGIKFRDDEVEIVEVVLYAPPEPAAKKRKIEEKKKDKLDLTVNPFTLCKK